MAEVYATADDLTALGRKLTAEEQEKAPQLLEIASALLRRQAKDRKHDLDSEIGSDPDLGLIAKKTVVKAVVRSLDAMADGTAAVSQESQSALGYSASFTYLNAGQALYFLRNELKELGLLRQRYGVMEVYGFEKSAK